MAAKRKPKRIDPVHANIARLRREHGLSQSELAAKLDIDETAVSHWETGHSAPNRSRLHLVAEIFGVTVGELFTEAA